MTRNLLVISTVAVFGLAAAIAGAGDTRTASACDDATKSAAAKSAATSSSCCAKDGTASASTDAKKVHNSMIKSAMVAPGAGSAVLNTAAFGAMVTANGDCDWCPPEMCQTAAQAAAMGCSASKGAVHASTAANHCAKDASMTTVNAAMPAGHSSCDKTASAASAGCTRDASTVAAGGGEACEKKGASASAAKSGCCESGAKSAKAGGEACSESKSASLKGVVDELPYRENKRVVLAGSYACGHCTLDKTAECAPMLKTADGKVYPLLKTARSSDMRSVEGKNLEVSGTVKKIDGVKFIDVKSYKAI